MQQTHWKKYTNPLYIGAYDFDPNEEKIGTIAEVRQESVIGPDGKKDDCIVARFQESYLKPLILNATNCKMISKLYKSPYIENWIGKRVIMCVKQVKAFGDVVEAVRIKAEIPKSAPKQPAADSINYVCSNCAQVLQPFGQMSVAQLAEYTKKKYGFILCADCAKSAADKKAEPTDTATEA